MLRKRFFVFARLTIIALLFVGVAAPEWPAFHDEWAQLRTVVGLRQFDFVTWLGQALYTKGEAAVAGNHLYLDEAGRQELVLHYLDLIAQARRTESGINQIYANPDVVNPAQAAQELEQEATQLREEIARLQPLAEAIVQEQVADILLEEGFGLLGRVWPPVSMHMTPLPSILIVSPRHEIRRLHGVPLVHGLPTAQREYLEERVYEEVDLSALVVPIGGLGIFPAMILETSDIFFLADVVAHEWAHHWLTLRPLGIRYAQSPAMFTINETTASIVGREIGERVIERYYPEFMPPPRPDPPPIIEPPPDEPPRFDFRAEMAETRVAVDRLLAEGRIEEAEAYMEERRRFFVANGYSIRKLNQAYFAFYGMYADRPGAAGDDPVGPMVVAVREASLNLNTFMETVAPITSLADLEEIYAALDGR